MALFHGSDPELCRAPRLWCSEVEDRAKAITEWSEPFCNRLTGVKVQEIPQENGDNVLKVTGEVVDLIADGFLEWCACHANRKCHGRFIGVFDDPNRRSKRR